ncbi:MAG TPA: CocE/NonD family hydrolase, partial [Thermoanaerobaculia bacterium]|nr:CocE/NonD family hydrolase [Thermoanaerobaculia bacterium]
MSLVPTTRTSSHRTLLVVAAVIAIAAGSLAALRGQETATRPRPQTAPIHGPAAATSPPRDAATPKLPDLARTGSDIASGFEPPTEGWNYERRTAMIPMRDGVRLYTVMIVPKQHDGPMPIVITRTPYDADAQTSRGSSPDAAMTLGVDDELLVRNG